jgi:hypothetical protein
VRTLRLLDQHECLPLVRDRTDIVVGIKDLIGRIAGSSVLSKQPLVRAISQKNKIEQQTSSGG